jgi:catechol 2,3-dioxygenase-like lactoylglutathione lyase family enzyme
MARALIPELVLLDPEAGATQLQQVLGFRRDGPRMALGDQVLIVSKGVPDGRHGRIGHLALAVPDVQVALKACMGRGGQLSDATPKGPLTIPEFWENGVDYVFLNGPEGAKVELIARRPPAARLPWGHDHIGISCADFAPMRRFFLDLGFTESAAVTLNRPEGHIDVAFLAWGNSVVELYCLPETRTAPSLNAGPGFWRRIRAEDMSERCLGPEGIEVLPL